MIPSRWPTSEIYLLLGLMVDDYMWSKDQIFVWDAKTLVQTLDKMNNSRPIIKIFLFLYTERTECIFSSNFANFFISVPHESARYAKMVFLLRIG